MFFGLLHLLPLLSSICITVKHVVKLTNRHLFLTRLTANLAGSKGENGNCSPVVILFLPAVFVWQNLRYTLFLHYGVFLTSQKLTQKIYSRSGTVSLNLTAFNVGYVRLVCSEMER